METPPKIGIDKLLRAQLQLMALDEAESEVVQNIAESYDYWDSVKYKKTAFVPEELWALVKAQRMKGYINVWPKYNLNLCLTNKMQSLCHEFDMNFGGSWAADFVSTDQQREQYLVSSLMEEAISSSQMEGASTTRRIAKDMLRKNTPPQNKSQQMIVNNYQTIRFITENKDKPLTEELLLRIHALMTNKTLRNAEDVGRFRTSDEIVVADGITNEVVHTPPSHTEIPEFISSLCEYFNSDKAKPFVHPVIRALVVHFMIAYVHPFVDGNGRTARALFYWYMLRQGYWLTEYLSISRIIYKSKKSYENAFLHTEHDDGDMGYFISYNLRVLELAFKELQNYIKLQNDKRIAAAIYIANEGVNERQAGIMKLLNDIPGTMITVKEVETRFGVTPATAKKDIVGLMQRGFLKEIPLNKVKRGYVKA